MGIAFIRNLSSSSNRTGPRTASILTSGVILMKQIVMLEYNIILMHLLFQHCTPIGLVFGTLFLVFLLPSIHSKKNSEHKN